MIFETYAAYLVLPCTVLIFAIGYYLGTSRVRHERSVVLQTLSAILQRADELSHDVDSRNIELSGMERAVEDLSVPKEMQAVHERLLGHISEVILSNKKLEDDLTAARYTLEQQARELDRTREEARTDELSQLGNRRAFEEAIHYRLSLWKRQHSPFALVLIDIDHFKWINDSHGHQAGDLVVRGVGHFLKQCLSAEDFVARIGGDEFAILLDSEDRSAAVDSAERIRATGQTQHFAAPGHGERIAITFSLGLAFIQAGDDVERLMGRADDALYRAKAAGRNCLRIEVDQDQPESTPPVTTS